VTYRAPRPLQDSDDRRGFNCQPDTQGKWLREQARQAHKLGTSRVFVVTELGSDDVVAYFAWCMASVAKQDTTALLAYRAGGYAQPVALLSRLGVHVDHSGKGLGRDLLRDILLRTARLMDEIGCRGLHVHAEDDRARAFYLHLLPEFEPSPANPLRLVLLTQDIHQHLQAE